MGSEITQRYMSRPGRVAHEPLRADDRPGRSGTTGSRSDAGRLSLLVAPAHDELSAHEPLNALALTQNGVGKHLNESTVAGFLIQR